MLSDVFACRKRLTRKAFEKARDSPQQRLRISVISTLSAQNKIGKVELNHIIASGKVIQNRQIRLIAAATISSRASFCRPQAGPWCKGSRLDPKRRRNYDQLKPTGKAH
jgi:hypothetical protein